MVGALAIGAEGPRLYTSLNFSKTLFTPQYGYLTLFRSEGSEKEGWHLTSVTPLPVQVGSLATATPNGNYGLWEQLTRLSDQ